MAAWQLLRVHQQRSNQQGQGGKSGRAPHGAEGKEGSKRDEEDAPIEPVESVTRLATKAHTTPGRAMPAAWKVEPHALCNGRPHHACWPSLR